jgi:hypothetical protein
MAPLGAANTAPIQARVTAARWKVLVLVIE